MESWQQRVIQERKDLDQKRYDLYRFIASQEFQCLPRDDRELLGSQHQLMTQYSSVLTERINRF